MKLDSYFLFLWAEFTNCLESNWDLIKGAKCKPTRQQEKQFFILGLLSSDHSGSTDRILLSGIYIINVSDKQTVKSADVLSPDMQRP